MTEYSVFWLNRQSGSPHAARPGFGPVPWVATIQRHGLRAFTTWEDVNDPSRSCLGMFLFLVSHPPTSASRI